MPDLSQRVRQINESQKQTNKRGRKPAKKPLPPTTRVRVPETTMETTDTIPPMIVEAPKPKAKAQRAKKAVTKQDNEWQEMRDMLLCCFCFEWMLIGLVAIICLARVIFVGFGA